MPTARAQVVVKASRLGTREAERALDGQPQLPKRRGPDEPLEEVKAMRHLAQGGPATHVVHFSTFFLLPQIPTDVSNIPLAEQNCSVHGLAHERNPHPSYPLRPRGFSGTPPVFCFLGAVLSTLRALAPR